MGAPDAQGKSAAPLEVQTAADAGATTFESVKILANSGATDALGARPDAVESAENATSAKNARAEASTLTVVRRRRSTTSETRRRGGAAGGRRARGRRDGARERRRRAARRDRLGQ